MAKTILGIGTSHSPVLSLPGGRWRSFAERDRDNTDLVFPPNGWVMTYDEAIASVAPGAPVRPLRTADFIEQSNRCQRALDHLSALLIAAEPDITVIITDDQEEWFFEDNMPALAVYWGESAPIIPRQIRSDMDPQTALLARDGYGDIAMDVPVAHQFGRFLVEHLVEHDVDVSQFNVLSETYGGQVMSRYPSRHGERARSKSTAPRPMGLPHGASFVIKRLFRNQPRPILPIFLNTCYPPNVPTPRRSFHIGRAIGAAIASWSEDATVAVVASGGLSHFVVDEELDRALLRALEDRDADALEALPRHRMYSGTSEMLNWIATAGVMHDVPMQFDLVDYVAAYRTEAGTGGGWGFGCWRSDAT